MSRLFFFYPIEPTSFCQSQTSATVPFSKPDTCICNVCNVSLHVATKKHEKKINALPNMRCIPWT